MARVSKQPKKEEQAKIDIVKALEFVCLNQKDEGTPGQTHCYFNNGFVTTFDGIVALGYPINNDLLACPQSRRLLTAVGRASGSFSLSQVDAVTLALQAGKFRAAVPCLPVEMLASGQPDEFYALLDNGWRDALTVAGQWASDSGQRLEHASVYCTGQSFMSTDGIIAVEYWHGYNMPEMIIPKMFISIINKIKQDVVGFGFNQNGTSITLYFADKSWCKTQLYDGSWQSISKVFDKQTNPRPLPKGFKDALDMILPFTESKVYVGNNQISTNENTKIGASFDFASDQCGIFNPGKLRSIIDFVDTIDFCTDTNKVAIFYGNKIRGAICQLTR
jgi:hypothetical protein